LSQVHSATAATGNEAHQPIQTRLHTAATKRGGRNSGSSR
jgi:hypothetical protein